MNSKLKSLFKLWTILLSFIYIILSFTTCTPDEEKFISSPVTLSFSEQAIVFDTVFNDITTITERFMVYNPNRNAIRIQSIFLGGGSSSPFFITINGQKGQSVSDVELLGGDSLLVLVEATIPRNPIDSIFLAFDSILFDNSGLLQDVKLLAWGENVEILSNATISSNTQWTSQNPYLIMDSLIIEAGVKLEIEDSTRVYFFNDAFMQIDGLLETKGDTSRWVQFLGFRREPEFSTRAGQWQGLIFSEGSQGNLEYTSFINAQTGISAVIDKNATPVQLNLKQVSIQNMNAIGLDAQNVNLSMQNSLVSNCLTHTLRFNEKGSYQLEHCTIANNEFNFIRNLPSVAFQDESGTDFQISILNSIIWGNQDEEVLLDATLSSINLQNSILKTVNSDLLSLPTLLFDDPEFESERRRDFQLKTNSPAINQAPFIGVLEDILGRTRDNEPDIGAYEFFEE